MRKRGKSTIKKSDEGQKSEQLSYQSYFNSVFSFLKQKRVKLIKDNMLQSEDVMVHNIRVQKFQIDSNSLRSFLLKKFFFPDSDETEEESKEDNDDIDYDQVLITQKFKVITCENNLNNIFNILNELVFNRESSLDKVRQRI